MPRFLLATAAYAQKPVMLNAYGAYVFDDKFDTYYSSNEYIEGKIKGGFQWGVGLEVKVRDDYGAELLYFRQDTQAPIHTYYVTSRDRTIAFHQRSLMFRFSSTPSGP